MQINCYCYCCYCYWFIFTAICYYTGILPPRSYKIDQASIKFIIGLSKNPSANLVQNILFCVHQDCCNVLFAKYPFLYVVMLVLLLKLYLYGETI